LWVLSALAVVPGCTPGDDSVDVPVSDVPSFEEFRATVPRFEDSWTVEGDIAIHSEEELRAYYETHVARAASGVGTSEDALIIGLGGTNVNGNNIVPAPQRHNMTFCVSSASFGSDYGAVVDAMDDALRAWERTIAINYIHDSSQDNNCTSSNDNVWFNVRRVTGGAFGARAFFPNNSRSKRELLIDAVTLDNLDDGTLIHELGHTLGFRHEFNHDDYPIGGCSETNNVYEPVPYDAFSVMHYPTWDDDCPGSRPDGYAITKLDRMASQSYYGAPADRCSENDKDTCWTRDAWCESAYAVTGERRDLCRWDDLTKSQCESPTRRGIWTTASSGFSQHWPSAVPDGASAACITQVNNLKCSPNQEAECLLYGASCEQAYHDDGHRHDLCRWESSTSAATCPWPGIWTTKTSGFAQDWPTAVGLYPSSKTGACITQIANLP
jgi:hypothetical protein